MVLTGAGRSWFGCLIKLNYSEEGFMKASRFLLAAAFFLAVATVSVSAQTTYTWTESTSTDFTVGTNWTPTRTTPATNDVLVFSGAFTPTATVTNIPTQTIGEMHAQGNVTANLASASAGVAITIAGGAAAIDLEVPGSEREWDYRWNDDLLECPASTRCVNCERHYIQLGIVVYLQPRRSLRKPIYQRWYTQCDRLHLRVDVFLSERS
ncbi:MAG: hypothetical protein DMF70_05830 [Acidobacteria bacterium]|nr:MAG: hypothetical protein DMF70_05830 [Acidobacteriota bacterium]